MTLTAPQNATMAARRLRKMFQPDLDYDALDSNKVAQLKQLLLEFQDLASISGAPSPKVIDAYSALRLIVHFEKIIQRQGARNRRLMLRLEKLTKSAENSTSKYTEEFDQLEKVFSESKIEGSVEDNK